MNKIECESCIKRKTIYCPNSEKCFATKDKPFYQNRIMLLKENQELKNQQKEFISYLEKEIVDCRAGSSQYYSAIEHLKLYNKVIGGDK